MEETEPLPGEDEDPPFAAEASPLLVGEADGPCDADPVYILDANPLLVSSAKPVLVGVIELLP